MLGITFYNRDFSKRVQPWWGFTVDSLEWQAMGGPSLGQLSARPSPGFGSLRQGAEWADVALLLRAPVEIWQDGGGLLWWGYVNSIQGSGYRVSLDELTNSVAAAYYYHGGDFTRTGEKIVTAWASDAESILAFGLKQKILTIGQASDGLALNLRDAYLATYKTPFTRPVAGAPIAGFKIGLKGWWSTLSWKYFGTHLGKQAYTPSSGEVQSFGDLAPTEQVAQAIYVDVAGWKSQQLTVPFRKVGFPADDFTLDFCADAAGVPGAVIGTATLAGGSCPSGITWVPFSLSASTTLATSTPYWIVARRSGALDPVNYYQVRVNGSMDYDPANSVLLWNGGAWVARDPVANLNFSLVGLTDTTLQLGTILGTGEAGQFLAGSVFAAASWLSSCAWRDGFRTGRTEAEDLLNAGNLAGARLLATVGSDRKVYGYARSATADIVQQLGGTITTASGLALDGGGMVGHWARIAGPALLPAGGSVVMARDVWIEGAKWQGGRYSTS